MNHERTTADLDRQLAELVEASRQRLPSRLHGHDRTVTVVAGSAFLVAAAVLAAAFPWERSPSPVVVALLVALHALASRVQFEIGAGSALPTQLVLVPMLFVLPVPAVPLAVAAGYLLGSAPDFARRRIHLERVFVLLAGSSHALGPALVFAVAGQRPPTLDDWPVYAVALAAQFAFDFGSSAARDWLALGVPLRLLARCLAWVYAVDSLLAPIGLLIALGLHEWRHGYLFALPLLGLIALFARERRLRIDAAVSLTNAYKNANEEARRDALTGLGNRLAWEEALAREERRVAEGAAVSLVVLDVDGLKLANDARGHHFGDDLLRAAASVVRASVRETDVVARTGGDEIAVLMANTDERGCRTTVARLELAFRTHPGVDGFMLSAAVGYASCPPAASLLEAVATADARMYERKRSATGRLVRLA